MQSTTMESNHEKFYREPREIQNEDELLTTRDK